MYEMSCYYIRRTSSLNFSHECEYISSSTKKSKTDSPSTDQTDKRLEQHLGLRQTQTPQKNNLNSDSVTTDRNTDTWGESAVSRQKTIDSGTLTTKSINNIEGQENVENERYLPFPPISRNPAKDTNTNLFSTTETVTRKKFESDDFHKTPNDNRVFLKTTLH
jgi:hypothetical protein